MDAPEFSNPLPSRPGAYLPDRILAGFLGLCQIGAAAWWAWRYPASWKEDAFGSRLSLIDWISENHYWNGILDAAVTIGAMVVITIGVLKNRGWAFAGLLYLCAKTMIPWIGVASPMTAYTGISLGLNLVVFLYSGLRLLDRFGPRVSRLLPKR